ncbi:MAG: rod shape-determining protein MreC [Pseudoflavonifractor sp.]|nr:rod shape-determining protein MreC [Alloprevotella sp.]MCM1117023.1 rod shape-determining protein MreC [Pseudoflavonifractor sp.]
MRNIYHFVLRYSTWILFIIYAAVSLWLLLSRNPFQRHVFLTSANAVSGALYAATNSVTSYFYLREINEDLQQANARLSQEILSLKGALADYRAMEFADTARVDSALQRYSFEVAHVINNTVNRPTNYITLDRGSDDGIRPEMGVIDQNGIIGIVNVVGKHTSRVISLLNPYLRVSCKIKGQTIVGSLVWDGNDPTEAILEELPRHAVYAPGDTVVTSGYSSVFPEGIIVGVVMDRVAAREENFRTLRVKLSTDFNTLSTVRVIIDSLSDELCEVEDDGATERKTSMPTDRP